MAPGISDSGEPTGILGSGSIVFVQGGNEHPVHLAYDALIDRPHHKVDGRAYVKRVAITSEPEDGDHYTAGEAILVGVTFDRAVSIEPKPAITIEVGEHEKRAQYHRGSFSKTLVFRYEVDEEDVDLDGISVPRQNGFRGSGHVWEADTRFGVNERIPKLAHQSAHRVNGVLPTVVASEIVSEPASGDVYRFGETIEISLEFDGEVDVVGQPSITILLDASAEPRAERRLQPRIRHGHPGLRLHRAGCGPGSRRRRATRAGQRRIWTGHGSRLPGGHRKRGHRAHRRL